MSRTSADVLEGTPLYTPPEAITSPTEVDDRSDLYSLGAVGYFLLCGTPVFDGRTSVEVFSMHLHVQPVPPSVRRGAPFPEDLEGIIMNGLAKKPAERPDGARELWHLLRSCRDAESWNVYEAEKWWKIKRSAIEKVREEKRRRERKDVDLPAPPTVAVPRKSGREVEALHEIGISRSKRAVLPSTSAKRDSKLSYLVAQGVRIVAEKLARFYPNNHVRN